MMRRRRSRLIALLFLLASIAVPLRADIKADATSACPYPTAHDAPLDATEKLLTTTDDYTLYRVEFNGIKPGSRVPANLYLPHKSTFKAPYPAVLLQYGTGGNKNTNYIVAIGQIAVARGMAVLTIDAPDRGERKGKEAPKMNFFDMRFFQYLGDYSRAIDYLAARNDVDKSRIAYVGISWGAITGVTFAAHDPRIKVIASLVGGGNFAGLIPGGAPEDLILKTKTFDPYYHIALIAPRPLLLVNVTHDQLVPRLMADALQKAAPDYAKRVWLEADHFFNGVDRQVEATAVIEWVIENLPKP
ncbi:MAG: esterase [Phycisphaerales bacterium]|nr:esterase [Phycisphaerales bacterium]